MILSCEWMMVTGGCTMMAGGWMMETVWLFRVNSEKVMEARGFLVINRE